MTNRIKKFSWHAILCKYSCFFPSYFLKLHWETNISYACAPPNTPDKRELATIYNFLTNALIKYLQVNEPHHPYYLTVLAPTLNNRSLDHTNSNPLDLSIPLADPLPFDDVLTPQPTSDLSDPNLNAADLITINSAEFSSVVKSPTPFSSTRKPRTPRLREHRPQRTPFQRLELDLAFRVHEGRMISLDAAKKLGQKISLSPQKIRKWFHYKRHRINKANGTVRHIKHRSPKIPKLPN